MNNRITEDYCSFKVSKLLKEKGFNVVTDYVYNTYYNKVMSNINSLKHSDGNNPIVSRPTHALAIKWMKVNFGIWIDISTNSTLEFRWTYTLVKPHKTNSIVYHCPFLENFNSPQEATEAALLYTLKNLIP